MATFRPACVGVPVDHRFGQLPIRRLTHSSSSQIGYHPQIIENYGRRHRKRPSTNEVNFAKWLSLPETKGDVLIVLKQPAMYQKYFDDHDKTVEECASLRAINIICEKVVGRSLAQVSCFDAFPFQSSPWDKGQAYHAEEELFDEAYEKFLDMVEAKQPDVIICCYQSPHATKYQHFQSRGIRGSDNFRVTLAGKSYLCANGFHPSYAINHIEMSSVLRTLLIAKISRGFCLANGIDLPYGLMADLSNAYAQEMETFQDRNAQPDDVQKSERFQNSMDKLEATFHAVKAGTYLDMGKEEMYRFIMDEKISTAFQECALMLGCITVIYPKKIAISTREQWSRAKEDQERDLRSLTKHAKRICQDFLSSFGQSSRRNTGVLPPDSRQDVIDSFTISSRANEYHCELHQRLINLVTSLDDAYTCQGPGIFSCDAKALDDAFWDATLLFEDAMSRFRAERLHPYRIFQEDDLSLGFASLSLGVSSTPRSIRSTRQSTVRPSYYVSSSLSTASTSQQRGASTGRLQLDGPCRRSRHTGHTFRHCPENTCFKCRQRGHIRDDCSDSE